MRKAVCLEILFFLSVITVTAKDVYVDQNSVYGTCNDAYTRLQNNITHPWCTINASNYLHAGGDTIYILPGEYRDMMFPKSGTASQYTVFSGLGNRTQIKVLGSEKITGWTQYNGNIYVANFPDSQKRCESYDGNYIIVNSTDCWEDRSKWYTRADMNPSVSYFLSAKGPNDVTPGTYYLDKINRKLYISTFDNQSLNTHNIECSVRTILPLVTGQGLESDGKEPYAIYWPPGYVPGSYFRIQNLTIMHSFRNALALGADNEYIDVVNNEIMYNSGGASCAANPAAVIRHKRCGSANPPPPDCDLASGINIINNSIHDQGSDLGPAGNGGTSGGQGIEYYHSTDSIVENNEIYNVNIGIYVKSGNNNITARNNYIHDYGAGFHYQLYINNSLIEGNRVINGRSGVDAFPIHQAYNTKILQNTIDSTSRTLVLTRNQLNQTTFKNNIVMYGGEEFTVVDSFGPATINESDYNIFYDPSGFNTRCEGWYCISGNFAVWQSSTGNDLHSRLIDPLVVSRAAKDYRLQPSSPAIDTGVFIPNYHCALSDTNGGSALTNCRHWCGSAPDIGAIEYCPGSSCTLAYDQPTCNCISFTELNNAIQGWYTDSINIPQLMQVIKAWKTCSN